MNEVSIYASLSPIFNLLYSKPIKNCMESTFVTKVATIKNTNGEVPHLKVPISYGLKSEVSIVLHC